MLRLKCIKSTKITHIKEQNTDERVRRSSTTKQNREIDQTLIENLEQYGHLSKSKISKRLEYLNKEWDIEKTLEVNASSLALTGLLLGTFVNKRWYILPGAVATFLLQHGLQGWCPPLPLFLKFGIRTRQELEEERIGLKITRGDFEELTESSRAKEIINVIRR